MGGEIGFRKNIDVVILDFSKKQHHAIAPVSCLLLKLIKALKET